MAEPEGSGDTLLTQKVMSTSFSKAVVDVTVVHVAALQGG